MSTFFLFYMSIRFVPYLYHSSPAHRDSPKRDNQDDKDTSDYRNRSLLCYVYGNIRRIPPGNFLPKKQALCKNLKNAVTTRIHPVFIQIITYDVTRMKRTFSRHICVSQVCSRIMNLRPDLSVKLKYKHPVRQFAEASNAGDHSSVDEQGISGAMINGRMSNHAHVQFLTASWSHLCPPFSSCRGIRCNCV